MERYRGFIVSIGMCLSAAWSLPSASFGQAAYFEGFEDNGETLPGDHGPQNLINQGWVFSNQSEPIGPFHWTDNILGYPCQDGEGCLEAGILNVDGEGIISNWAVLPEIPGQQVGDVFEVYVANEGSNPDAIAIRYSPSGGTDTGTGADDIGDFTELLLDFILVQDGWQLLSVDVPGPGRFALHRYINPAGLGIGGGYLRVDSLSIGQPEPPPPIEEITWFAADNPHIISGTIVIEENVEVTLEPGVVIQVLEGSQLQILGSMIGHATPAEPVTFTGGSSQITPPVSVLGTLDLEFADVAGRLEAGFGGTILAANCNFTEVSLSSDGGVLLIDDCEFADGAGISAEDTMMAVRNSIIVGDSIVAPFVDDRLMILRGYVVLDNVMLDGSQLSYHLERNIQPPYINNVTVSNNIDVAGLDLSGANFFFGSDVLIEGNLYPAELWSAGILPGSTLPPTGNVNNYLLNEGDGDRGGSLIWGDAGVPYVVTDTYTQHGGGISLRPGTTVQLAPGASIFSDPAFVEARGLPGSPVTFERLDPAQAWGTLKLFDRLENCVIDGGNNALSFSSGNQGPGFIDNCVISNCVIGMENHATVRKTQFLNNDTGVLANSLPDDLNGETSPNSFEGNTLAVAAADDALFNWWGDASGPSGPQNPGGTGDPVNAGVPVVPFLTTAPDFANAPPIVHLLASKPLAQVGDRLIVSWETVDDGTIVSHRVLFQPRFGEPFEVVADNLPPAQRSVEFIVPEIPQTNLGGLAAYRVEAIDDAGQMGWDEGGIDVPWPTDDPGTLTIVTDLTGTFTPGEPMEVCWTVGGGASATISLTLLLDGDQASISLGGSHTGVNCATIGLGLPFVSTDSARIALTLNIATNVRKTFYSDTFAIRPDPRLGDQPPTITMLTPVAGDSYEAGSLVPITWTAADDESLRSFTIQLSYDGGIGWQTIADELPGDATSFDWPVPESEGFADVRVRVIAHDLRFQNSSDGADRVFTVLPASVGCEGDANGDGAVDPLDTGFVLARFGCPVDTGDPDCDQADQNSDGSVDPLDVGFVLARFGQCQ